MPLSLTLAVLEAADKTGVGRRIGGVQLGARRIMAEFFTPGLGERRCTP
jgi:hypothetical protein